MRRRTWNLRARFLTNDHWRSAFDPVMVGSHLDYPLGHPLSIARLWVYEGLQDKVPQWMAIHWLVVILLVMYSVIRRLRGPVAAMLALLVLVSVPLLAQQTSNQYADLPLTAMMLMTLGCIVMARETRLQAWWIGTGFCMAGAMWTKNEGMAFALACTVSLVIGHGVKKDRSWVWLLKLGMGALPVGLGILAFKIFLPQANDLIQSDRMALLPSLIFSPERHGEIIKQLAAHLQNWELLPMLLPVIWLMPPCRRSVAAPVLLLTTLLYALCLYGAYVITPHDLRWHIGTSATRLAAQLWPLMVLTAVMWRSVSEAAIPAKLDPGSMLT